MMKALAASLSLVLASGAQAQSLKEKYELSEQCGKRAEERFKELGAMPGMPGISYKNHYNFRLNKCFYVTTINDWEGHQMFGLVDVNENGYKWIGFYHASKNVPDRPVECQVQEKHWKSEAEWRALIRQFMED